MRAATLISLTIVATLIVGCASGGQRGPVDDGTPSEPDAREHPQPPTREHPQPPTREPDVQPRTAPRWTPSLASIEDAWDKLADAIETIAMLSNEQRGDHYTALLDSLEAVGQIRERMRRAGHDGNTGSYATDYEADEVDRVLRRAEDALADLPE